MSKGKVKYFNDLRGWGFIACDDPTKDIYFHYTAINMDGYRTVKEGQEVFFELAQSESGLQASSVVPTD